MSRSIRKALQIINLFSLERPEWGVTEAARALGLPKSTTSELMSELMDWRLLRRASGRGRYRLGWRLFELSQTLLETTEFRNEARRVMEELVIDWGETVHLAVLKEAQSVYVEKLKPTPAVTIEITRSGALLPAYCSGVGKVLLAHAEWAHVARLLGHHGMPVLTQNTITTMEGLAEELGRVRERGYAYDREETLIGLCCVAAPIYDFKGGVIAAVSISVLLTGSARERMSTPRPSAKRPDASRRTRDQRWMSTPATKRGANGESTWKRGPRRAR